MENIEELEDTLFYFREHIRQNKRLRAQFGDVVGDLADEMLEEAVDEGLEIIHDEKTGQISAEEAEALMNESEQEHADAVRALGDPGVITGLDMENEARVKNLPYGAQYLLRDAAIRASDGLSKEQWISEVLDGHADYERMQFRALQYIALLWADGPWPWPRDFSFQREDSKGSPQT